MCWILGPYEPYYELDTLISDQMWCGFCSENQHCQPGNIFLAQGSKIAENTYISSILAVLFICKVLHTRGLYFFPPDRAKCSLLAEIYVDLWCYIAYQDTKKCHIHGNIHRQHICIVGVICIYHTRAVFWGLRFQFACNLVFKSCPIFVLFFLISPPSSYKSPHKSSFRTWTIHCIFVLKSLVKEIML